MSIQERISKYLDNKGITAYKFCKELNFSMGYLDKRGAIGTDKYLKIIEHYTELNPDWLLTGKGEMIRSTVNNKLKTSNKENTGIPLMPSRVLAGLNTNSISVMDYQVEKYFVIPTLSEKGDFVWPVEGNSMSPTFENDDFVVGKFIDKSEFKWETPYVITVNHAPMLKRLIPSVNEGCVVCRSDNPTFRDFEIKQSEINTISKIIYPKRH